MSQQNDIVHHLHHIGPITPLEALQRYGCFRLSAIIFDLKKMGYDITTTMVSNGKKRFASYKIERK